MASNISILPVKMSMAPDKENVLQGVDNKCSHGNTFHGLEIWLQVVDFHERHDI